VVWHLGRALDYKQQIDDFVAKTRDIRQYELSQEDWDAIKLVTQWLKAFRSATTQMSITKHSTLSSTHAIF
jgi:sulfur relay (sulfurtransferase) DsrC/TusE family protein